MLPGVRTPLGRVDITTGAPSANARASGGILVEPTGEICAIVGVPTKFVNGFGVTDLGQLCIAFAGVIAGYTGGLPFTALGQLVAQLNVVPPAGTPFVGGVAVGPAGVYMTDSFVPPDFGFSNGFSGGFDAN